MIDRRTIKNFDWFNLCIVLSLSIIGVLTIYSATRPLPGVEQPPFYLKQSYWILFSTLGLLLITGIDYRWFQRAAYLLFVIGIILLVLVLAVGRKGLGAQRWIPLGPLSFQPAEFFKIFFIMAIARYLSGLGCPANLTLKNIMKMAGIFLFAAVILLLKQPDLGTAIMFVFIFFALIMVAGVKRKTILIIVLVALISIPFIGHIIWDGLKEYQRNRIVAFIEPAVDPLGIGYHITQSKVAIGSGGFLGKGYLHGTQGFLRFLPERHTDFIFSIFSEEWGFVGALLLFVLYLLLLLRSLDTARKAKDLFGTYLSAGLGFMLAFYFVINIGMTLGIMPVVGVPLPFLSYGGTALLSNYIAIGIIMNVRMRRFSLFY